MLIEEEKKKVFRNLEIPPELLLFANVRRSSKCPVT